MVLSVSKASRYTVQSLGFTLIELLVVVAIISLLVSILLPSLSKARDLAKSVVCQSNLRSVGVLTAFYLDDNQNIFPYMPDLGTIDSDAKRRETWQYKLMLVNNGDGGVFDCPASTASNRMQPLAPSDYSINRQYQWGFPTVTMERPKQWGDPNLRPASDILYMVDSYCSWMTIWADSEWHFYRIHNNETAANVLCLDLHVEGPEEPWKYINGEDASEPAYFNNLYPNKSK